MFPTRSFLLLIAALLSIGGGCGSSEHPTYGEHPQSVATGSGATAARKTTRAASRSRGRSRDDRPRAYWIGTRPHAFDAVSKWAEANRSWGARRQPDVHAVHVTIPPAIADAARALPGVRYIEEAPVHRLVSACEAETIPWNAAASGARDIWDRDGDGVVGPGAPTGAGQLVCVLDSGVYTAHKDFAGIDFRGGYPSTWNVPDSSHATGVIGVMTSALNGSGIVGVSPGRLSIYAVKVTDVNGNISSAAMLDGLDRCTAAGAKIINLSFGSNYYSKTEERKFKNLQKAGVLVVAAAGNQGADCLGCGFYPAAYPAVLSVGAVDQNLVAAPYTQQNSEVDLVAPGEEVPVLGPYNADQDLLVGGQAFRGFSFSWGAGGAFPSGPLVDGGSCAEPGPWSGAIVLCREDPLVSSCAQMASVDAANAKAMVLYGPTATLDSMNNVIFDNTLRPWLQGLSESLGTAALSYVGQTASFRFPWTTTLGSDLYLGSGTSFAAPHVAAIAALLRGAVPTATAAQIRSALESTALDLGPAGRDNTYGKGLVRALAACRSLGGCL